MSNYSFPLDHGYANPSLTSKVISFLRLPLIIAVVFIHSSPHAVKIGGTLLVDMSDLGIYGIISTLLSQRIARIAVPLFFFISGYLFFGKGPFSESVYIKKLKKRSRTILLPYLIWNVAVIFMSLMIQIFSPGILSGDHKLVVDWSVSDWLLSFWNYSEGYPICFQFWFLRDLMVVMLFSPIIFYGIKYLKKYWVIILGVLWIAIDLPEGKIPGFTLCSFFFFSFGAYYSINKLNFVDIMWHLMKPSIIAYIILCTVSLFFRETKWIHYINQINIVIGIVAVISMTNYYIQKGKWKVNTFLSESSFFIYAYHATLLGLIVKFSVKVILPTTNAEMIIIYFIVPIITILLGLGIYYILKRYLPTFTSIITGGR